MQLEIESGGSIAFLFYFTVLRSRDKSTDKHIKCYTNHVPGSTHPSACIIQPMCAVKEDEFLFTPEQLVASMTGTLNGVPLPWQSSFVIQTMGPDNNTAVTRVSSPQHHFSLHTGTHTHMHALTLTRTQFHPYIKH